VNQSPVWSAIDPRRNDLTRVLGALAAVVGLLLLIRTVAGRWLPTMTRGRPDRPSGVIEVLARYPISRGQHLVVLKFARRVVLLHQSASACSTLAEMTDAGEVASLLSRLEAGSPDKNAGKFRAALESFESEHKAAMARDSRAGAALAAGETQIIDLTRTRIIGDGRVGRRAAR
jgi:hypothetical protein